MWDVVQHLQIRKLNQRQSFTDTNVELHATRARRRADDVEDTADRLVLVIEAMWEILSERLGVTEEELVARIQHLDGLDGEVDGRRGVRERRTCPACQAIVPARSVRCQFCGADTPDMDPFAP
jgi:hypothetical protein